MKNIILTILVLSIGIGSLGFSNVNKSSNVEEILSSILKNQDIEFTEEIRVEKVADEQLEHLGSALFYQRHPEPKERAWMIERMGGENSQSLKAANRLRGYRYLQSIGAGEFSDNIGPWGMRMRGYGNRQDNGPMVFEREGRPFFHRYGFGLGPWFWLALILSLSAAVFFVVVKKRQTSPLDIAKSRYAKGEISKEEYEQLKKDL